MAEICQKVEDSSVERAPSIKVFSWNRPASDAFLSYFYDCTYMYFINFIAFRITKSYMTYTKFVFCVFFYPGER